MDMVVENMPVLDMAKNTVEIVVHVSENLEERQRSNLVVALEDKDSQLFLPNPALCVTTLCW